MAKGPMNGALLVHDELLDHYKYPRHRGTIENPHFSASLINHSCGDRVSIAGRIHGGVISACSFQGEGCVLSQAAASMLMEALQGLPLEKLAQIDAQYMQQRIGIIVGPTRLRCVLLALEAVRVALKEQG